MFTIQDELSDDVKEYQRYLKKLSDVRKSIDHEARELLNELRKVNGWECMIKNYEEHYAKYPDKFFDWCSVSHTENAVQFYKKYAFEDGYEVLEISFRKSLKEQVRERMDYLEEQKKKKEMEERENDYIELERIKKKYGI